MTEQKTVEVPQLHCSDKVVDVPVVQVVVLPQVQTVQNSKEIPQFFSRCIFCPGSSGAGFSVPRSSGQVLVIEGCGGGAGAGSCSQVSGHR